MSHFIRWRIGLAKAETQTTEAERECLARHAQGRKRLAEIGVWHGVTTCRLRRAMSPDGVVLAVDPFPRGRLGFCAQKVIAKKELSRVPGGTVQWVRKTGAEAALEYRDKPFDFVFIDGDHTYEGVSLDWERWSPLVAPGGVIALHDSRPTPWRPDVTIGSVRSTQERTETDPRFTVAETVDSLTIVQRV